MVRNRGPLGVIAALVMLAGAPADLARAGDRDVIVGPLDAAPSGTKLAPGAQARRLPRYAPGRIVVKYKPATSVCLGCSVSPPASSDSLDHLNQSLGVRSARALFAPQGLGGQEAS